MANPSPKPCTGCGQLKPLEIRVVSLEGAVGELAAQLGELLDIAEKAGAMARAGDQRSRDRHGMHLVRGELR